MLVLEILGGWLIGSCTLGPLLAWAFFYPVRSRQVDREKQIDYKGLGTVVSLGRRDIRI